jgi:hypothetical protein
MRPISVLQQQQQQQECSVHNAEDQSPRRAALARRAAGASTLLILMTLALPQVAFAVPSFARQTGMPCSQCHVVSFGVALTAYGHQFKLNGYTFGEGEHPMPLGARWLHAHQ